MQISTKKRVCKTLILPETVCACVRVLSIQRNCQHPIANSELYFQQLLELRDVLQETFLSWMLTFFGMIMSDRTRPNLLSITYPIS